MKIITHYNVDLDAASSAALALIINSDKETTLEFISTSATWDEIKDQVSEEDLILDVDVSGKGLKGVISCFSSYLATQDKEWAEHFYEFADKVDIVDSNPELQTSDINDIFLNFKYGCKTDEEVVRIWKIFLEGIIARNLELARAYEQLESVTWVKDIAIMPPNSERILSRLLKRNGANYIIYAEEGAQGIIMSNKIPMQTKERLASALPEWFFHEKGFLLAWGTAKGFKSTNSEYTAKDLVKLILDVTG